MTRKASFLTLSSALVHSLQAVITVGCLIWIQCFPLLNLFQNKQLNHTPASGKESLYRMHLRQPSFESAQICTNLKVVLSRVSMGLLRYSLDFPLCLFHKKRQIMAGGPSCHSYHFLGGFLVCRIFQMLMWAEFFTGRNANLLCLDEPWLIACQIMINSLIVLYQEMLVLSLFLPSKCHEIKLGPTHVVLSYKMARNSDVFGPHILNRGAGPSWEEASQDRIHQWMHNCFMKVKALKKVVLQRDILITCILYITCRLGMLASASLLGFVCFCWSLLLIT